MKSRNREKNGIGSEKIMSLSLKAIIFYKPKSLPHFGKLMQFNEIITLLGMRRLSSRCGWIICTIQVAPDMMQGKAVYIFVRDFEASPWGITQDKVIHCFHYISYF